MKKVIVSTLTTCALLSSTISVNAQVINEKAAQATQHPAKLENSLVTFPKTTGKHQVGSTTFDWTDFSRKDFLDHNNNRELMVQAWYPIDSNDRKGKEMEPYIPATINAINQMATTNKFGELFVGVNNVNTQVYKEGVLSSKEDKYPIVLFSHGFGLGNWNYQWLTRELASQGFIVFSIDHTHFSAGTEFNDGRFIPINPQYINEIPNLTEYDNRINNIWVKDLQFVIHQLDTLNKTDKNFRHRLDLDKIAAIGHSMGGATAARALQVEPKIKSAINMDGAFFGLTGPGSMTKPFAFIATENTEMWFNGRVEQPLPSGLDSQTVQEIRDMFKVTNDRYKQAVSGPAYDITIAGGAVHGSFTDLPLLRPYLTGTPYDDDSTLPPNPEHVYELSNHVILSFLEKTLNGKKNTILDRENVNIPDLTIVQ
ncbi:alpha/beta hydrolase family protein [Bacillus sp. S14(2024)]|uniref:alpha/beta hydrolase family protein n=1 Tax=Bacillus sp. S14(2024) TaxID=3162884 RepID=UPI003D23C457